MHLIDRLQRRRYWFNISSNEDIIDFWIFIVNNFFRSELTLSSCYIITVIQCTDAEHSLYSRFCTQLLNLIIACKTIKQHGFRMDFRIPQHAIDWSSSITYGDWCKNLFLHFYFWSKAIYIAISFKIHWKVHIAPKTYHQHLYHM